MIDIKLIRAETDSVKRALLKRMDDVDLDSILELDDRRRSIVAELDATRARRKALAKQFAGRADKDSGSAPNGQEAVALRESVARLESDLATVESSLHDALAELPNLPSPQVPAGGKEANQVLKVWGEPPPLGPWARDHVQICTDLGLVDYKRGTKIGGNGFWIYTGLGAALEWALLDFFCREHHADGFQFMLVPHLLLEHCGFAAGQFPKFRDDVFHISSESSERGHFLLPTSETAILSAYSGEVLDFNELPVKVFAYTPCYRREAGAHRSEERGTIRGHQFNKVEMFAVVLHEDTDDAFAELVRRSEVLLEKLGLHYRTSLLASRDASAAMCLTHDVEVWIPSIGVYKEASSVSYAGDYQARRANIRVRRPGSKRPEFVHTLNGSGLATSRVLPALVEQMQQEDGSLLVPEPLRDWLGCEVIRPPQ